MTPTLLGMSEKRRVDPKRLDQRLKAMGLRQQDVGATIHVSQSKISRAIKGQSAVFSDEELSAIAGVLDVTPQWLLGDEVAVSVPHNREITIEREPERPATTEEETPLERAITAAFDPTRYSRHDLNAAAESARTLHRLAPDESNPSWAVDFLEAARDLREQRQAVTVQSVKDRVLVRRMRTSRDADERIAQQAQDEAAAELEALRNPPSSGKSEKPGRKPR